MADSTEYKRFEQFYRLTERMNEDSDKDTIADVARILALNCAHYKAKYGVLPLDETLTMLTIKSPNETQATMLADDMETLASVIAKVDAAGDDEGEPVY